MTFFSDVSVAQFLTGVVEGREVVGKPFKETVMLGVNPDTKMVVLHKAHADGVEIVSLGNWTQPAGDSCSRPRPCSLVGGPISSGG